MSEDTTVSFSCGNAIATLRAHHPRYIAVPRQPWQAGSATSGGNYPAFGSLVFTGAKMLRPDAFWRGLMDKKIAGLLGAAAAIATVGSANATEVQGNPVNQAASYRELLDPVPNAVAALKADDARRASRPAATEKLAQISISAWVIITTTIITMIGAAGACPRGAAITTIITTTITTATITAAEVIAANQAGSLAGPAFCCPQQIAISAVKDRVGV